MKSLRVAHDALEERPSEEPVTYGQVASAPAHATTTSREERLIKFGLSIESEPPSGHDMTFTHAVFAKSVFREPRCWDGSLCGNPALSG